MATSQPRRTRAIGCALWYGLIPSRLYEPTPHYNGGYWAHARMNLVYALKWLLRREDDKDREFEREVNGNG